MIKIGQIKVQDTGYVNSDNSGTQASSANRANSGVAISLKTAEFIPSVSSNVSAEPDVGSNTPSEVNIGSLNNMQFELRCVLNRNTDISTISALLDLVSTYGYKLLWYDYTNATSENNNGQLISQIATNAKYGDQLSNAEKSAFSISDNFYTLHVVFNSILPRDSGNSNLVIYSLKGVVKKVLTSVLT